MAIPINPPRASISRTICPLANPPIAGLQDICPIRDGSRLTSATLAPGASPPTQPPRGVSATDYNNVVFISHVLQESVLNRRCTQINADEFKTRCKDFRTISYFNGSSSQSAFICVHLRFDNPYLGSVVGFQTIPIPTDWLGSLHIKRPIMLVIRQNCDDGHIRRTWLNSPAHPIINFAIACFDFLNRLRNWNRHIVRRPPRQICHPIAAITLYIIQHKGIR